MIRELFISKEIQKTREEIYYKKFEEKSLKYRS